MKLSDADILDIHADHMVTIFPLGEVSTALKWVEEKRFHGLREAMKWIGTEGAQGRPYHVNIHDPAGHTTLSAEIQNDLVLYLKSVG